MVKSYSQVIRVVVLIASLMSLLSCQQVPPVSESHLQPTPTPDCTAAGPLHPGWKWGTLQIGVSTQTDIIKVFGQPEIQDWSPCVQRYQYSDDNLYFDLMDGVLYQLIVFHELSKTNMPLSYELGGFPVTLRDAMILYGDPDVVLCDSKGVGCDIAWSQQGIALDIGTAYHYQKSIDQTAIFSITYMGPEAIKAYLSWLSEIKSATSYRNVLDRWERWLPEDK